MKLAIVLMLFVNRQEESVGK